MERDKNYKITYGGDSSANYLKLLVTAEFPEEDTGYIEEGYQFCVPTRSKPTIIPM